MSSNSLVPVFTRDDARELAVRAAEHVPVTGGWLLDIGMSGGGRRYVATTGRPGGAIVAVRQAGDAWFLLPLTDDAPEGVRFDTEADALAWLTYLADLHTAAVA